MSTLQHPRPLHPYPQLVAPSIQEDGPRGPTAAMPPLNQTQRKVIAQLQQGGRVLFDMEAGRALIYSVRQGMRKLSEMTVRVLAQLVRCGWLVMVSRDGRLVQYVLAGRQGPVGLLS